jgi:hypothetical protein
MSFPRDAKTDFFREVFSQSNQFLGAMYLHYSAHKWAIKEYPGQWFDSEEKARAWLISKNEPTVRG